MDQYSCSVAECLQPAECFCQCSTELIFLCVTHHDSHLQMPGNHLLNKVYCGLSPRELIQLEQASGWLTHALNASVCQILYGLTNTETSSDSPLNQDCRNILQSLLIRLHTSQLNSSEILEDLDRVRHAIERTGCQAHQGFLRKLHSLQTIGSSKEQKVQRLANKGRDIILELHGILDGKSPSEWASDELLENEESKVCALYFKANKARADGLFQIAIDLYQRCASFQRRHSLQPALAYTLHGLGKAWEHTINFTEAANAYLEALSLRQGRAIRPVAEFEALLNAPCLLRAGLAELLEVLARVEGEINRIQAYEAFLIVTKSPDVLTKLAFVELENGLIALDQVLSPEELDAMLDCLPVTRLRLGKYQFIDPSIVDFVVGREMLAELKQSSIGNLHPQCRLNLHNIVTKPGLRQFMVEIIQDHQKYFETILEDIVQQSRDRIDITQASANAITLLNQMNYSFAGKSLSRVKISGADLSGADLSQTDLTRGRLNNIILTDCNLTETSCERASLVKAKFGNGGLRKGHSSDVTAVSFSPDGNLLASGSEDTTVIVWATATGRHLRTLRGHSRWVTSLQFSPSGSCIASGSYDKTVALWDAATGTLLRTLQDLSDGVVGVHFSPAGETLTCACFDSNVVTWEVATGQRLYSFERNMFGILALRELVTMTVMAARGANSTVAVYTRHRQLCILRGHYLPVTSADISVDGTKIVSGGCDTNVLLWEIATGNLLFTCFGHSKEVTAVQFSSDCLRVVSASWDRAVMVWSATTGQHLHVLYGHCEAVKAVSFSPSGELIASGGQDKAVMVFLSK